MNIGSFLAIYFIIWWATLFVVLPLGVRNAHEAGEVVQSGHDRGAPVVHGLGWKILLTTFISALIYAALYVFVLRHGLDVLL